MRERFLDHGLSAVRLFAGVRAMGFTGSEIIVRRFVHTLRESSHKKLTVRFETPPGGAGAGGLGGRSVASCCPVAMSSGFMPSLWCSP